MNQLYKPNKRTALVAGSAALLAFGTLSSALAVPPDKSNFGPVQVFGEYVGSCETFDILSDYTINGQVIVHYDKDGNISHVNEHYSFTESTVYNSAFPDVMLKGGPGEGQSNRLVYSGDSPFIVIAGPLYKITLPGGGVIFHEAGRFILDLNTFETLVQVGPSDWSDGNVDALCAALTP